VQKFADRRIQVGLGFVYFVLKEPIIVLCSTLYFLSVEIDSVRFKTDCRSNEYLANDWKRDEITPIDCKFGNYAERGEMICWRRTFHIS